jgi:Fic family protein
MYESEYPMLFSFGGLDAREVEVLQEIEDLRQRLSLYARQPKRWYGLLSRNVLARAVRGSNSIEGYSVTPEDALAAVQGDEPTIDPKTETWLAVIGYRQAMTLVLQKAADPFFSFSEEFLKSLQFMMVAHDLGKNPGLWRLGPIFVRREDTGEQVYEGPPVEVVPALMAELIGELNAAEKGAPDLIRAAMAHLNLVMIHPFSDGNGRMGRCLQTLVLGRTTGVTDPAFSSIEEYLGKNRDDYYAVLAHTGAGAWHPDRDTKVWIRFNLTAHYRQALTLLRRTREMERLWEEIERLVRALRMPERSIPALTNSALGHRLRNPTYRASTSVSEAVAGADLRALVKAGLLEAHGEKRGRFYLAAQSLRELRAKVAESKGTPDPFQKDADGKLQLTGENLVLPGFPPAR